MLDFSELIVLFIADLQLGLEFVGLISKFWDFPLCNLKLGDFFLKFSDFFVMAANCLLRFEDLLFQLFVFGPLF
jgi:hypothetical protein